MIILRFASLRSLAASDASSLTLATTSPFQKQLSDIAARGGSMSEASIAAQGFVKSSGFVSGAQAVTRGAQLVAAMGQVRDQEGWGPDMRIAVVRRALGEHGLEALVSEVTRARDSVLAAYLLPDAPNVATAQELVRAYALAALPADESVSRKVIALLLRGPIALPEFADKLRGLPKLEPAEDIQGRVQNLANSINALAARHDQLSAAKEALSLHAEDELVLRELGRDTPLSALYAGPTDRAQVAGAARQSHLAAGPSALSPLLRASVGRNVVLSEQALKVMAPDTITTLRSLALEPASTPLAEMRTALEREHSTTGQQIMELSLGFSKITARAADPIFLNPAYILDPIDAPDVPPPVTAIPPISHTDVAPLGVADLILVRTHVARYEDGEIASIENVLGHEKLTHTSRRLDTSETTTTDESETTDLRSLTQAAAERGSSHVIQAVGPGIGPVAAQEAADFGQDATDQVSSSSMTRVRRTNVQRIVKEREETYEHLLDNSAGSKTAYGVYHWLDKIYSAQAFSYGPRLLYDLVVPEPAAMFREALARPRSGLPMPAKPARFTTSPTKLSLFNWAYYSAGHGASGVDAPPAENIVISEAFPDQPKDALDDVNTIIHKLTSEVRNLRIPKGYKATHYNARVQMLGTADGSCDIRVSVGVLRFRAVSTDFNTWNSAGSLGGETETIPIAVEGRSDRFETTVAVKIFCTRTTELLSAWQVKTHAQILEANRRRFADYEAAVASRDAAARLFLQNLPPARRAAVVAQEVKRATLELLTAQNFSSFNATRTDASGFPFPDPAAAVGLSAYMRFFEQAVEWDKLAYTFYPYFWSAQNSWVSKLLINDGDGKFADFLASGAARVVLPVRRGYEAAFERFLKTGLTPSTAEMLDAGGPLWISMVDALRQEDGATDDKETPIGEPWEFRIATDLVRARVDGSMPKWILDAGNWTEAADTAF